MKIFFTPLNLEIDIKENFCNLVVIESQTYFSRFISALCDYEAYETKDLYFENNGSNLDLKKNLFIRHSPFLISLNDKKLLSLLYEELGFVFFDNQEIQNKFFKIRSELNSLMYEVSDKSAYSLNIEDSPDFSCFLKLFNVRYQEDSDLLSKTIDFISIISSISKLRVLVVFVNFLSFFEKEEVELIIHQSLVMNVSLMFIENKQIDDTYKNTSLTVIDKDLCEV